MPIILFSQGTTLHTKEELLHWMIKCFKMKSDPMRGKWWKIEWNEGLFKSSLHYICTAWGGAGSLPSPTDRMDKAFWKPTQNLNFSFSNTPCVQRKNNVEYKTIIFTASWYHTVPVSVSSTAVQPEALILTWYLVKYSCVVSYCCMCSRNFFHIIQIICRK